MKINIQTSIVKKKTPGIANFLIAGGVNMEISVNSNIPPDILF
jgi:hypothetical protein